MIYLCKPNYGKRNYEVTIDSRKGEPSQIAQDVPFRCDKGRNVSDYAHVLDFHS